MDELQDWVDERDDIIDQLQNLKDDVSEDFKDLIDFMICDFITQTEHDYDDFNTRIEENERYERRCQEREYWHDRI